jgi:hypothetical protein
MVFVPSGRGKHEYVHFLACALLGAVAALAFAGCGGGGGGGPASAPAGGGGSTTYSITGSVTGSVVQGISISLGGPTSASTSTDASGHYAFSGLVSGTYSVIPNLIRASFSPATQTVSINGASVDNVNFRVLAPTVIGVGLPLLPDLFSSRVQYRTSLLVRNGAVFYTDSSVTPLKKMVPGDATPTALAARFERAESVAVQGQYLLWVDGDRLNRTAMDGSSTTVLQTAPRKLGAGVTADLVSDGTNVYWATTVDSSTWAIQRVPLAGGPATTLVTTRRPIESIASDASSIYWSEASLDPVTPDCACGSSIKMIPKIGGAVTVLVDNRLNGTMPPPPQGNIPASWLPAGGIALSGSRVIFAVAGVGSYTVMAASIPNGALTTLVSVPSSAGFTTSSIVDLTVDSTNVYWIDIGNLNVSTVATLGGLVNVLASGLTAPMALQVAGGQAYWTEAGATVGCCLQFGGGSIRRVPVTGGDVEIVTSSLDAPGALFADELGTLVWTEYWRVGKRSQGTDFTVASGISGDLARIAADQANVYILDGGLIKVLPLGGGVVQKLAPAHGQAIDLLSIDDHDIATDGKNVYWTAAFVGGAPAVRSAPVSGGAVTTLAGEGGLASPMDCYHRIALDSNNVYWASSSALTLGCSVKKVPMSGGAVTTLVDAAYLLNFTVDGTNVYYSDPSAIRRVSVNGGPTESVVTNVFAEVLTHSGASIYWLDPRSAGVGGIYQAPKVGAPATSGKLIAAAPLFTDPTQALETILVDQDWCYWTESLAGAILRESAN